jgi:hypothetical protein
MMPTPTRFLDLGPVEQVEYLARELAEWRTEGFRTPQFARRWMRRVRIAAAACEESVDDTIGMIELLADGTIVA